MKAKFTKINSTDWGILSGLEWFDFFLDFIIVANNSSDSCFVHLSWNKCQWVAYWGRSKKKRNLKIRTTLPLTMHVPYSDQRNPKIYEYDKLIIKKLCALNYIWVRLSWKHAFFEKKNAKSNLLVLRFIFIWIWCKAFIILRKSHFSSVQFPHKYRKYCQCHCNCVKLVCERYF